MHTGIPDNNYDSHFDGAGKRRVDDTPAPPDAEQIKHRQSIEEYFERKRLEQELDDYLDDDDDLLLNDDLYDDEEDED